MYLKCIFLILLICVWGTDQLTIKRRRHKASNKEFSPMSIIKTRNKVISPEIKNFEGELLAYVTPWNHKGYEKAIAFRYKINYVAPVWYQIKRDGLDIILGGDHDVDQGWIAAVRNGVDNIKITPRFLLEHWGIHDMEDLATYTDVRQKVKELIVEQVKKENYDGIVLESIPTSRLRPLIQDLHVEFSKMDKPPVIILVLHPMPTPESDMDTTHHGFDHTHDMGWTAVAVAAVAPYVHRFSINTYDFKHPGPNAPLPWVKKCIESWISVDESLRRKILMGIPFYGHDNENAIVGETFARLLHKHKPKLEWDNEAKEAHFTYRGAGGTRHVYYPIRKTNKEKLNLARKMEIAGVALWELGQGFNALMNDF